MLGGTTTNEVVDFLELLLLSDGFLPTFYQSEYNRYYEDATFDAQKINDFKPDVAVILTHVINLMHAPAAGASEEDLVRNVGAELDRYRAIWDSLHNCVGCQIVQNNFENPPLALLGSLDAWSPGGQTRFVYDLNSAFAREAAARPYLLIHDINSIAARFGLDAWIDWDRWYSYKILTTLEASYALANSLAAMVSAMRGRVKKCLVLDLDNTLWGGVIGDDGLDHIQIGTETALSEAYSAFQSYCLKLRERGILLAVCSKNEDAIARSGFDHPDSRLKIEHFSAFKANWEVKSDNIREIAKELNIGLDSLVFVDDNPAERAIVQAQLPMVAVPDVGADVVQYPAILSAGRYFETVSFSKEDLTRAEAYAANKARTEVQAQFNNFGEYLDSLEMTAEIALFKPVYLDRITQLINKTNQFNLTTRRYTAGEIDQIAVDAAYVPLYGRLIDRFGDNGLISVIIGRLEDDALRIDLWIMSCRVLKREMEFAMLDALVDHARRKGARKLVGRYAPTEKNMMVADHYANMGFTQTSDGDDSDQSTWSLDLDDYTNKNVHIRI